MTLIRVISLGVALLLVLMGAFTKRGWLDWRHMVRQNQELAMKIEQAQEQKANLERQIQALQFNVVEQEHVIRQVLGYVRPKEIVIEFQ